VTKSWQIATALVAAGADVEWCERAGAVLPSTALEPGLEWVASSSSAAELITQVKESTGRVSDLVAAVRSYSQVDRASAQQIDVTEGIESTLVMLGHALGASVRVERDFDQATPRIEAYPGELNQVWTNLITNAIDAMHGEGTLSLVTRAESAAAVIKVGDTGEGMTPQIAAHAFDAFFTTKDVGKGTGLGLDIARRIVNERHGGTITIESQPGRTVVTVRLPLRAPQ
jgi:signal transduction histidine kinase